MKTKLFDQWVQTIQSGSGFTSDLVGRKPLHGYAVGISKETEFKIGRNNSSPTYIAYHIQQYIRANLIPLINGAYMGVWIDLEKNQVVFDISEVLTNRQDAILLAKERKQDAIWDIENDCEIRVEKFVYSWLTD